MSSLRSPLHRHAPLAVDDATAQRLWRGVVKRREQRSTRRLGGGVAQGFALGALVALLLVVGIDRWRGRAASSEPQQLALGDGRPLGVLEAGANEAAVHAPLADGSRIALDPGTLLQPLENSGQSLVLLLVRGRATFDVRPHGPRHWSIECGLATVEVTGTRFVLTRSRDRLRVEVERGAVLVRGERVAERVQRLGAGQALEVVERSQPFDASSASTVPAPVPSASAAPTANDAAWRDLARRGAYADAYRLLGPGGVGSEVAHSASARDLMQLADVARLSGHPADAVAPLERVVSKYPGDPSAPLAAFTLGKIHLGMGQGARAAADFDRAIALGLSVGLVEDAYVHSIEAREAAGDAAGARARAEAYLRRFPTSKRAEELAGRLGGR